MVHGKAGAAEPLGQPSGKIGIILDQKDADGGLPLLVAITASRRMPARLRYQDTVLRFSLHSDWRQPAVSWL
jgi:hypothetical protein